MHALRVDTKDASIFSIEIVNCDQKFVFKARNIQECVEWQNDLRESIRYSQGYICKKMIPKDISYEPWKFDNLSEA